MSLAKSGYIILQRIDIYFRAIKYWFNWAEPILHLLPLSASSYSQVAWASKWVAKVMVLCSCVQVSSNKYIFFN